MKTLMSSCSKAIIDNNIIDKGFPCFKDVSLGRSELCLLPSEKRSSFHLLAVQHRRLLPVFSSSSPDSLSVSQVDLETAITLPEDGYPSKTAYVKFQLQKECSFGDHIFMAGDHPMFGLWDPENAVPLTWSEGHVWSVELDVPIGVPIQFKFILKRSTGDLDWQPGPDRIFKSWETEKKIVICEDWDEAEYQKLLEEDPSANQDLPVLGSEMAIIAENINLVSDAALSEELATVTSAASLEKPLAIVDENISYSTEDLIANANNVVPSLERANYQNDEALATSKKNVSVAEDFGRVETVQNPAPADVEPNLVAHEGTPVLVPGSTSSETVSAEEAMLDEDEKNSKTDASVEVNEAECHKLSELYEKQELEEEPREEKTTVVTKNEEEQLENQNIQNPQLAKGEPPEPEPFQSNVLQSDIQWGHKTFQKLLNSLRLL